jgi:membrane associated rhomboid family serine protease
VWSVAAIVLAWITRCRSFRVAAVLVAVWAVAVVWATTAVLDLAAPGRAPAAGTAAQGALVGALVALTPMLVGARARRRYSPDSERDDLGERGPDLRSMGSP